MEALERVLREIEAERSSLGSLPFGSFRLYAIAFDLDTNALKKAYHNDSFNNAWSEIGRRMKEEGFTWTQGSVYFGDEHTDAVKCVLVIQRLARELPWFGNAVRDIRMLRIEENNDLKPAIPQPKLPLAGV